MIQENPVKKQLPSPKESMECIGEFMLFIRPIRRSVALNILGRRNYPIFPPKFPFTLPNFYALLDKVHPEIALFPICPLSIFERSITLLRKNGMANSPGDSTDIRAGLFPYLVAQSNYRQALWRNKASMSRLK
jgi:hypothetical protein